MVRRSWNDRWFLKWAKLPPQTLGTLEAFSAFQGKHLIRAEGAVAFMHHRGELLPGRQAVRAGVERCARGASRIEGKVRISSEEDWARPGQSIHHPAACGRRALLGGLARASPCRAACLAPPRAQAWLHPAQCPYIAHLVHSNGFRPLRWGAKLDYFAKPSRNLDWFLLRPGGDGRRARRSRKQAKEQQRQQQ